ncbi:MAG: hypothetical protein ABL879_01800 [Devosia sp.]
MRIAPLRIFILAAVLGILWAGAAAAQEETYECVSQTRTEIEALLGEFGFDNPRANVFRTPEGVRVFPAGPEADCRLLVDGQDTLWFNGPDGGFYLVTLYFAADATEAASMADSLRLMDNGPGTLTDISVTLANEVLTIVYQADTERPLWEIELKALEQRMFFLAEEV